MSDMEAQERQSQSNVYAAKKTAAQSLLDLALLTANCNQLRQLLTHYRNVSLFYINLGLIVSSLIIQIVVGTMVIFSGRHDIANSPDGVPTHKANDMNNKVLVGAFLLTVINVFATSVPYNPNAN